MATPTGDLVGFSNSEVTAQLIYFYGLLAVLLKYIDHTKYHTNFLQIVTLKIYLLQPDLYF